MMHFDIKRAIESALAATREHFGLTSNMENLSHHTSPETACRACSLWMQANREALQYSGPAREVFQRDKEQAEKDLAAARQSHRDAERVLVQTYPSAFTPGAAADAYMEIDMSLVQARDTAQRRVTGAQAALQAAEQGLRTLAKHEAAIEGLTRILGQLIGKEAR